jgi:hypothetical protein
VREGRVRLDWILDFTNEEADSFYDQHIFLVNNTRERQRIYSQFTTRPSFLTVLLEMNATYKHHLITVENDCTNTNKTAFEKETEDGDDYERFQELILALVDSPTHTLNGFKSF